MSVSKCLNVLKFNSVLFQKKIIHR